MTAENLGLNNKFALVFKILGEMYEENLDSAK